MNFLRFFLALVLLSSVPVTAAVPAWPAFRGPNSSGVAADARPPVVLSPTNAVLWKVSLPFSPSSPCVWGDRVFVTAFADQELQVRCYRRSDGGLSWVQGIKPEKLELFHRSESSPAASSPALDADHVVAYFGSFGLICHDHQGKERWRLPLPMASSLGGYGTATSPLIAGGLVVVSRDRDEGSTLLAVDLRTGRKVWETPRPASYGSFGTPILWRNGETEEVVVPGSLRLSGFALRTGREEWVVDGLTAFACTTPVTGDGLLYFAAWSDGKEDDPWPTWEKFLETHDRNKNGAVEVEEFEAEAREYYRGLDVNRNGKVDAEDYRALLASLSKAENLLVAVKPGGRGNITATHVAWKANRGLPYVASPLLYQGRVYCFRTGGMISSFDARTGQAYYLQERLNAEGNYYSSPVAADGRIYVASMNGRLTVVKAGGDKPEILHQADFGERIHASPAMVGDEFYLRTESALYAFGERRGRGR